ncbi:MAG: orotidine-5'-phosphate decarboxylase [Bdellovibrionales bacterium]|nr:orotidine-5'-phosphate decarboxylase [Bdellovibrionales bacterium]
MKTNLKIPIFAALDLTEKNKVLDLARKINPYVGGFKIGPRLSVKYGGSIINELSTMAPVFLDAKYYDIPSVTEASVRASFEQGASYVTVHAMCGEEALLRLAELQMSLNQQRFFRVVAVTILTSYAEGALPPNFSTSAISVQVEQLVDLVVRCGLNTVVCSPQEVLRLKDKFNSVDFITPGIRLPHEDKGDQKRILGPKESLQRGASAIVVGRPIYEAKDAESAAKNYFDLIQEGLLV